MQTTWIEAVGYLAAAAGLFSTYAKTMIPLRVASIAANLLFVGYGALKGIYPTLLVNCILLPLNFVRLKEMRRLVGDVQKAAEGDLKADWLRPFMDRKRLRAGDVLWEAGDRADQAVYIWSGTIALVEIDRSVHEGDLIGEMGLFNPGHKRMLTARCETDCEIGTISYSEFRTLYHQNPEFGFYLMRLVTGRLQENLDMASNPRERPLRQPR